MVDKMFKKPGAMIKYLAGRAFVLETVVGVLVGLCMLFFGKGDSKSIGILVALLTPFAAWFNCLLLYAFGELVEKTTKNEENTSKILASMAEQEEKGTDAKEKTPAPVAQPAAPVQTPTVPTAPKMDPIQAGEGEIICPSCGLRQRGTRKVCWSCGVRFVK